MESAHSASFGHPTKDLPRDVKRTELLDGGYEATWIQGLKPPFFVLVILGVGGFGVALIGVAGLCGGIAHLRQISSILMMTLGGGSGLIACILLAVQRGHSKEIILENTSGKRVSTTVAELYAIAEATPSKDRDAFLAEVKTRLDSKEFQANPLVYLETWAVHRSQDTPVQNEALDFFCGLIQNIDNSDYPWHMKPHESN